MNLRSFCTKFHFLSMLVLYLLCVPLFGHAAQTPAVSEADAIRFLRQSTFGHNPKLVKEMQKSGFTKFLDKQFNMKGKKYPKLKFYPEFRPDNCNEKCQRDNYTYYRLQRFFFENALRGKD